MNWQLPAMLLACAAVACTSDDFVYGGGAAGGAPACNNDGCGTECPVGTKLGPTGACEAFCAPWLSSVGMPAPAGLVASDDLVYAAGTTSPEDGRPARAMLQRADACRGQLADAILPMSENGSSAEAVASSAGTLIIAGSSEGSVTFAELDLETGTAKGSYVASSLPADAVVTDLSAGPSGAWLVGGSKTSGAWLAQLVGGSVCSATLSGAANASAVAALNDAALVVEEVNGKLRLVRVGANDCKTPLSTSTDLVLPVDSANARDILVIDSSAYLLGQARVGAAEPFGFVASVDPSSGTITAFAKWDPGPGAEALYALAAVGSLLFAGGASGSAVLDDDTSGVATLAAWKLPLQSGATPVWAETLSGRRVRALASNGVSLFALASTGTGISQLSSFAPPVLE